MTTNTFGYDPSSPPRSPLQDIFVERSSWSREPTVRSGHLLSFHTHNLAPFPVSLGRSVLISPGPSESPILVRTGEIFDSLESPSLYPTHPYPSLVSRFDSRLHRRRDHSYRLRDFVDVSDPLVLRPLPLPRLSSSPSVGP